MTRVLNWREQLTDAILTEPEDGLTDARVHAFIDQLCPFQLDIAYMPVPDGHTPGNIADWASKCAEYLKSYPRSTSIERIAAVIETFAAPLVQTLREAKRSHYHTDHHCDSGYDQCCPCCEHPDHGDVYIPGGVCDCSAGAWNTRVETALLGLGYAVEQGTKK